jgi:hypothetical protein
LARELLGGHTLVKLEVLGDEKTLYPNIVETLSAAQTLIDDGFNVMVYTSDDPIVAKELENIGCCAIMPLASLIPAVLGKIVYLSGLITSNKFGSFLSCPILVRRMATVIISAAAASVASFVSVKSWYFPEPTNKREL